MSDRDENGRFVPGHAKLGGSVPGSTIKRSKQLEEEADKAGAHPGKLLIKIIAGEMREICGEPVTKEDWKWALSEFCPYVMGKRKPVDSEGDDSGASFADLVNLLKPK